jgi:pimeloyl-ACP methyl ester carboxylesterase
VDLLSFDAQRHSVSTRSGPISYVDLGQGPVALFVHGVGTNALLWRNVIPLVSSQRRCVALDLPLHGHTPARQDQDFSLSALATVVEDFCDALDLHDIDLIANDTGGAVAQIFAARHPRRLASFTLTNCETHDNVPPAAFKPSIDQAARGEISASAPQVMANLGAARSVIFGSSYEHPEQLGEDVVRAYLEPVLGTPEHARQFERFLCSLQAADLLAVESQLRQFDVPTLVVWGTDDVFFDKHWADWLQATIPGVTEVVEVDGGRLFFPDERAAELAPHLLRHWAAARKQPSAA